jgi:carbon-monoxide dehydrogenase small subunit/xanthine dehydrogenase small subunit
MIISFVLNGKQVSVDAAPDRRAVDCIREDLGLTGTKEGCGTGECGACTILIDGEARLSCLMTAAQLDGREVTTIEGLSHGEALHPVQEAFVDHGAIQCGFCTPGMVLSAVDLLRRKERPSRNEIAEGLSGNLCRCTGYQKIIDAVEAASGVPGERGRHAAPSCECVQLTGPVVRSREGPRRHRSVYSPSSLDDLWSILGDEPEAAVVAGGTDVFPKERQTKNRNPALVFIGGIGELCRLEDDGESIFVGSAVTHRQLAESPIVRKHAPVLAQAAAGLGSPAIRAMGTVGGNVVTASPAGDTLAPLYVLDAVVETRSLDGFRVTPLKRFIRGPGATALQAGEILYGIWIPKGQRQGIHHFEKVGRRHGPAVSVASLACVLHLSGEGGIETVRLAWGSVGPTVVTIPAVEKYLTGKPFSADVLHGAMPLVREHVSPIDDERAGAGYRRTVAANLLLRLLNYLPAAHG